MGIPHFEDLSIGDILTVLDNEWSVLEKLDGSYFEFGLDSTGSFYSRHKGGPVCHSLDDWPSAGWTNSFKLGHTAAENIVDGLLAEGLIQSGDTFVSELLVGQRHNTILYFQMPLYNFGYFVIIKTPEREDENAIYQNMLERFFSTFSVKFMQGVTVSVDGKTQSDEPLMLEFETAVNRPYSPILIARKLATSISDFKELYTAWLSGPSNIVGFSIKDCLEVNLGRKSDKCGDRIWSSLKTELKQEREYLRKLSNKYLMMFKDIVYRATVVDLPSIFGFGPYKEGVVIKVINTHIAFKITNRIEFSKANHFAHIVKYWLIGGRRPARPSFLSRTSHWPIEHRLARLDVLLQRYLDNRLALRSQFDLTPVYPHMVVEYTGGLHDRMLNLFADTRQRIINGR